MKSAIRPYLLHLGLFLMTFLTTTCVGAEHVTAKSWLSWGVIPDSELLHWADFSKGLPYSISFLLFLTCHEFGHYFTARYYDIKTSLPYYIPVWLPLPGALNIGSFGAVIRLKESPRTTAQFFDIGIAGPLAGFVVSVILIVTGLLTLPSEQYLLNIHPEYKTEFGGIPTTAAQASFIQTRNANLPQDSTMTVYKVGSNLLMEGLKTIVPHNTSLYPSDFELYHYPLLFVGFLTLFFTALNLLPIGQLDGGHVIYGIFGRKIAGYVSRLTVIGLLFWGGTGLVNLSQWRENYAEMGFYFMFLIYIWNQILNRPARILYVVIAALVMFWLQGLLQMSWVNLSPNSIWLLYSFLAVRVIRLDHPPAMIEHRLSPMRMVLGILAILIFILCFTPVPIDLFS